MDSVRITNEMIVSAGTKGCGYTKKQLAAVGISWPPSKGWKAGLIGKVVPIRDWRRFSGEQSLDDMTTEELKDEIRRLRVSVIDLRFRFNKIAELIKGSSQSK